MQHKDKIRLLHILDEANEIVLFTEGLSFEDFAKDSKTVHAVIRALEVIGEAASKISPEYKENHTNIPWKEIIGMRNHLIHVYYDTDFTTIWKTVKNDIPDLKKLIKELLKDIK